MSHQNKKSKLPRRAFVKAALASSAVVGHDPIQVILRTLLNREASSFAQSGPSANSRRYIVFHHEGGPSRWNYDLLLNPGNDPRFGQGIQHGMATGFRKDDQNRHSIPVFENHQHHGLWVPSFWSTRVAHRSGGARPVADLLRNMLHLRGMDVGNPSHSGAMHNLFMSQGGLQSVTALAADYSQTPLSTINIGLGNFIHASLFGKMDVPVNPWNSNLISSLMRPFTKPSRSGAMSTMAANMGDLSVALQKDRTAEDRRQASVIDSIHVAEQMMAREFGDLNEEWLRLVSKYRTLMEQTMAMPHAGITDGPLGMPPAERTTAMKQYHVRGDLNFEDDPRVLLGLDVTRKANQDNLAKSFALVEFLVTHDLCRNMWIGIDSLRDCYRKQSLDGGLSTFSHSNDSHTNGLMFSTFFFHMYYAAQSACLLELVDVLKARNLFNDTLIEVRGEFNRNPRRDLAGADHGWRGASTMFYSGLFTKAEVFGNIYINDDTGGHFGNWGQGAPVTALGGVKLDPGHYGATVASLLGVPNPTRKSSLVERQGDGTFRLKDQEAQLVER